MPIDLAGVWALLAGALVAGAAAAVLGAAVRPD